MADSPYSHGIKPETMISNALPKTQKSASSGYVKTNMYTQTIDTGAVDEDAQDYNIGKGDK